MKESKAALLSPEDQEDVESPLPSNIVQPVRRRGAISAEPINEEDAATYIKKVKERGMVLQAKGKIITSAICYSGHSEGLQNDGLSVQSNCQECPVQSPG